MNIKEVNIPKTPGCYLFKDSKDQIIYVGKSKFLPKRVTSYFQKDHKDIKTTFLVREIKSVDFISTVTENEALLLEEDLIKLYKPKFNIKGKDDRTIKSNLVLNGGDWKKLELFYPKDEFEGTLLCQFTSGKVAREVTSIISDIFKLRSCSYDINEESVKAEKFRSCLEWHLGRCDAPCIGIATKLNYLLEVKLVGDIFNFNYETTRKYFVNRMKRASDTLMFEEAGDWKSKLEKLKRLTELLEPIRKSKLRRRVDEIKLKLSLKTSPLIIDAFDNSHTSGQNAVCGLVRFKNLEPDKTNWRKFIIKSGSGGDDYGSFEEVLKRRFKRLNDGEFELPNLIIMDGGKAQLSLGLSILSEFNLVDKIEMISISKDSKHRAQTIHFSDGVEVSVSDFREFSHIMNEVHRFSLDFHKLRRGKSLFGK